MRAFLHTIHGCGATGNCHLTEGSSVVCGAVEASIYGLRNQRRVVGVLDARGTVHISFSDKREKPESVRRGMWYEKYE